ncbi:MAG: hypothetical protein EZS26_000297 [Candidatus Ordinivivax streblomastigis]|jgi:hypothetical protein|uniref:Uncharacterized protein n=1 Tax=Candidatus Ordinivivax streblomastigis TaxID=2540710 RepID=A0A5M8P649_9BACT|nr:MAG: hypothetical protein EZS26_000297 [Candidatus Ordinivivax streblomastigis]
MNTTLTLSLEQEVVQTMEAYTQKRGGDISELVKNYFYMLIRNDYLENIPKTPLASSLMGSLNAPDNADYKEELEDALVKKYL